MLDDKYDLPPWAKFAGQITAAGVAVLYLTIFAAFKLYAMIPALAAFVLMALAFALRTIEQTEGVRLTNYGEMLAQNPPTHEVEIVERTAWSCAHGIDRCDHGTGAAQCGLQ